MIINFSTFKSQNSHYATNAICHFTNSSNSVYEMRSNEDIMKYYTGVTTKQQQQKQTNKANP